ncbi:MAG TPA: hypothetical protein VFJ85_18770 [Acidimicrobiales bacterium]|nr:hypothetical protein [Acidimicrobiales bacterium]
MNAEQPLLQGALGVLREAEHARFTGSVGIAGPGLAGTVFLSEGRQYWAVIAGESDIAEMVARLPVNSIMVARIRWHMRNGLTLAAALDKLDDVDHVAVRLAVRDMAEGALRRLLTIEEGLFHMVAGATTPVGVLATWSLPRPPEAQPAGPPPVPAGPVWLLDQGTGAVELDEIEWKVVAALATPQTADVLATRCGIPRAEVLGAIERLRRRRLAAAPVAEARPAAAPRPPRPVDEPSGGDRRSNALRRLISAVRSI